MIFSYFTSFLHPFKAQTYLSAKAQGNMAFLSFGRSFINYKGLSFAEVALMSWPFFMIKAIYSLLSINLGIKAVEYLGPGLNVQELFSLKGKFIGQQMSVYFLILEVILFPLLLFLYAKFWEVVISFFVNLFDVECRDQGVKEVVNGSISSHVFYLIPVFGGGLKQIANVIYLFAGLKRNLNLTHMQSILIILSPFFLFLVSGVLLFFTLIIFFNTLF